MSFDSVGLHRDPVRWGKGSQICCFNNWQMVNNYSLPSLQRWTALMSTTLPLMRPFPWWWCAILKKKSTNIGISYLQSLKQNNVVGWRTNTAFHGRLFPRSWMRWCRLRMLQN